MVAETFANAIAYTIAYASLRQPYATRHGPKDLHIEPNPCRPPSQNSVQGNILKLSIFAYHNDIYGNSTTKQNMHFTRLWNVHSKRPKQLHGLHPSAWLTPRLRQAYATTHIYARCHHQLLLTPSLTPLLTPAYANLTPLGVGRANCIWSQSHFGNPL